MSTDPIFFFASIAAMRRANNFDILRLCFACVVVLAHCYDLSLQSTLAWIPHVANSRIAVEGFFAMSGYLIAGSYERKSSLSDYFLKRALRILPAYWATLIFSLLIGVFLSEKPAGGFLTSPVTWRYIFSHLVFLNFLQTSLPGIFSHNPSGPAVNGALWTIKIEVMFYLIVPLIALWSRKFGVWKIIPPLFLISILFHAALDRFNHPALAKQLPGQFCFFAVGMLISQSFRYIAAYERYAWGLPLLALVAYFVLGGVALEALAVGTTVLFVALIAPAIEGPTKYGDFSYGLYVFHYPVIQTLIAVGLFNASPRLAVLCVFAVVTVLAVISWNLLESPCLRFGQLKETRSSTPPSTEQLDKRTAAAKV